MNALIQRKLIIKPSSIHGMGVFAGERLRPGQVIEECHVLVLKEPPFAFRDYTFKFHETQRVLPLGAGAIYNHADQPNAKVVIDPERLLMTVKALCLILPGEEIFISYGKSWFSSRDIAVRKSSWLRRFIAQCRRSATLRFVAVLAMSGIFLNLLKAL